MDINEIGNAIIGYDVTVKVCVWFLLTLSIVEISRKRMEKRAKNNIWNDWKVFENVLIAWMKNVDITLLKVLKLFLKNFIFQFVFRCEKSRERIKISANFVHLPCLVCGRKED